MPAKKKTTSKKKAPTRGKAPTPPAKTITSDSKSDSTPIETSPVQETPVEPAPESTPEPAPEPQSEAANEPVMTTVAVDQAAKATQSDQPASPAKTPSPAASNPAPAKAPSPAPEKPKEDLSKYTIKPGQSVDHSDSEETSTMTEEEEIALEKRNKKLYIFGIVLAVIILITTIYVLYVRAQQAIDSQQDEAIMVEEVAEEPEATPEPTPIPKSDISLDVLNGSGVSGLAGKTATTFEDLGYEIYEIGNADSTEGNQVYINPNIDEDLLTLLFEDLEEELDISSSSGELKDSTASAQIILGE